MNQETFEKKNVVKMNVHKGTGDFPPGRASYVEILPFKSMVIGSAYISVQDDDPKRKSYAGFFLKNLHGQEEEILLSRVKNFEQLDSPDYGLRVIEAFSFMGALLSNGTSYNAQNCLFWITFDDNRQLLADMHDESYTNMLQRHKDIMNEKTAHEGV